MDLMIFLIIGVVKLVSTLFFLILPWLAWRKGFVGRAVLLTLAALGFAAFLWWPEPSQPSLIMFHIESQMFWFSVITLVFAPWSEVIPGLTDDSSSNNIGNRETEACR
jgi:hypothetical protein